MSEENVEIVRGFLQASQRGDEATAMGSVPADIEVRLFPAAVGERVFHGQDGVRQAIAAFASVWEDTEFEYPDFTDAGDHVVVQVRWRARGRGSGVETGAEFAAAYTLDQGKIVRYREFASREKALEAVGLSE
jgi:ketosteroid isomerase-like protein